MTMRNLFKTILTSILLLNLTIAFSQNSGGNPAADYAKFLGYKYEIRKNSIGAEYGVCIFPDSSECDDWDFFRGICGQKYSYCALKGCDTKTKIEDKGSYSIQYAVCCCKDSSGTLNEIPLFDFLLLHGDTLFIPQKRNNFDKKN